MVHKTETYEERLARLQSQRVAAEKEAAQRRTLREAGAARTRARLVAFRERLTPSPVVAETARKIGTTAYQTTKEVIRSPQFQAVKRGVVRAATSTPIAETYLTLGPEPQRNSRVWLLLEEAFGYSTFTDTQALRLIMQSFNVDASTARQWLGVQMRVHGIVESGGASFPKPGTIGSGVQKEVFGQPSYASDIQREIFG